MHLASKFNVIEQQQHNRIADKYIEDILGSKQVDISQQYTSILVL